MSSTDWEVLQNLIAVEQAARRRTVESWLPPPTEEEALAEKARQERIREEDELWRTRPPTYVYSHSSPWEIGEVCDEFVFRNSLGVGAPIPSSVPDTAAYHRDRDLLQLRRQFLGSKAQQEARQRHLERTRQRRYDDGNGHGDSTSEDEVDGRGGAVREKKKKREKEKTKDHNNIKRDLAVSPPSKGKQNDEDGDHITSSSFSHHQRGNSEPGLDPGLGHHPHPLRTLKPPPVKAENTDHASSPLSTLVLEDQGNKESHPQLKEHLDGDNTLDTGFISLAVLKQSAGVNSNAISNDNDNAEESEKQTHQSKKKRKKKKKKAGNLDHHPVVDGDVLPQDRTRIETRSGSLETNNAENEAHHHHHAHVSISPILPEEVDSSEDDDKQEEREAKKEPKEKEGIQTPVKLKLSSVLAAVNAAKLEKKRRKNKINQHKKRLKLKALQT